MRHELGEGGDPKEQRVQLEKLCEDYATSAKKLTDMGLNGEVLDLKARTVSATTSVTADEEELIGRIVDKKLITKAGGLFKCGVIIANCCAVTAATKKVKELEVKAKEDVLVGRKKAREDSGGCRRKSQTQQEGCIDNCQSFTATDQY